MYKITEYGAIADASTVNTSAINNTIKSCFENGGGTVYVPSGTFLTGSIEMKSNVNLFLETGAELLFINDEAEYPLVYTRWEGSEQKCYRSCIYGENVENVAILGYGTINGNGKWWWDLFANKANKYPRPTCISFVRSKRITISDVKIVNSPSWTVHPLQSANITINNVTIVNPKNSPNTDGIDPESCHEVRISNCYIDVGDDCIAIKAGVETANEAIACRNIAITNCTMINGHGGVVIGSEMSGNVENVVISNCIFEGTDRGIRLKSRRGRGGSVNDISINNIIMNNVICPFIMNLYYFCGVGGKKAHVSDKSAQPITPSTPVFKKIYISNVIAKNVHAAAGFIYGLAEMYVEDVHFNDVNVYMKEENAEPGFPAMMAEIAPMKQQGFYCRNAKNITFSNTLINGCKGEKFDVGEECDVIINNAHI
jgi:Endopolygalacturonase